MDRLFFINLIMHRGPYFANLMDGAHRHPALRESGDVEQKEQRMFWVYLLDIVMPLPKAIVSCVLRVLQGRHYRHLRSSYEI